MKLTKGADRAAALIFVILSIGVIGAMIVFPSFFEWAFARHHNRWSWYIRPLFLIPFCLFAYKRSLSGIAATIFLLTTSMFWFSVPVQSDEMVNQFLAMEMEYLTGSWDAIKILITLIVPISLSLLAYAFWKRSLWFGIAVMAFIAVAKIIWSAAFGGESGQSILIPAIVGLIVCIVLVIVAFRKLEKKKNQ